MTRLPYTKRQIERVETVEIRGPQWDQSCGSKKRFESEDAANKAAYRLLVNTGDVCKAYKCAFGNHYHIGHQMGAKRK